MYKGYKLFEECIFLYLDIKLYKYLNKFVFIILKENLLDEKIIIEILDEIYKNFEFCYKVYFFEYVVFYEIFIIELFLLNIVKFLGDDYDEIVLEVFCLGN